MISIQTAITPLVLFIIVFYIALGLTSKKRFVSPIFDFEYNLLIQFIPLI